MNCRMVLLGWTAAAFLSAASPQVWEISDFESFLKGRFEEVSLDSEGTLRLAPRLTPLLESEEALAWATAVAEDGAIYLGTGHQGRLFHIAADGTAKLHWQAPEIEIFALATAPGGRLFAATAPNGKVYEIDANGEGKPLFDPQQSYIWALKLSADNQHLYAATGDEGRIFRIPLDGSGEGELWLETGQRHAISMALDPQGKLLVGTDPNGLLYRVDGKQQAFALYDSDLPEIRAIAVAESGEIFFAAMGGAMSLRDQTTQVVSTAVTAAAIAEGSQPSTAGLTVPTVNYGVETAALFRLRPEHSVDSLWSSKEEDILGLDFDPSDPTKLLFITGRAGRVYRFDPAEDRLELLAQTDQRQATSLRTVGSTALLSAAYGGALARLEASPADKGEYTTGVRDTGVVSQWGRLSWRGAGRIVFSTRSGNSPAPDTTWSDWSAPIETPGGGAVTSPAARYIQWRARLERSGEEPLLEQATLSYLPQNQAPVLTEVNVKTVRGSSVDGASGSSGASSSDSTAAYSITVTASGDSSVSTAATSTQETKLDRGNGGRLSIAWNATDADGDDMLAHVEFRGEDEKSWKTLRQDVKEKKVEIDRDALADGRYRFRVTVSDSPSNPPEAARTARKVSAPVLIDHTPPVVMLLEISGGIVRFEARDAASAIVAAEYSVNGGPWVPVRADDGLADSLAETFSVRPDPAPGERLITLRVRDRAGNAGLGKALLTE